MEASSCLRSEAEAVSYPHSAPFFFDWSNREMLAETELSRPG